MRRAIDVHVHPLGPKGESLLSWLEARRARDERKAGIVVDSMPCPLLIVTGAKDDQWPRERYDGLWLDADKVEVEGHRTGAWC